jgi:hypothetical protein
METLRSYLILAAFAYVICFALRKFIEFASGVKCEDWGCPARGRRSLPSQIAEAIAVSKSDETTTKKR